MTIELNFEDFKQLNLFNSIFARGLIGYKKDLCETSFTMSRDEYFGSMGILENIENVIKPIREAIDEEYRKEKYLREYDTYLKLKEKYEGVKKWQ